MWKRTEVRTRNLTLLRNLLQEGTECTAHTLERVLIRETGPWEDMNRDAVLEQGYEASGLPPQVGHTIDSGSGLSITIDKIQGFINKTLSILSTYQ